MFAVVEFRDDSSIAAVPESWLRDGACYWPPSTDELTKLIQNAKTPQENWELYKCEVKRKSIALYVSARHYENVCILEHELEAEKEQEERKRGCKRESLDPEFTVRLKKDRKSVNKWDNESSLSGDEYCDQSWEAANSRNGSMMEDSSIATPPKGIDVGKEIRYQSRVLENVLLELKKMNQLLRRLNKDDKNAFRLKDDIADLGEIEGYNGEIFRGSDIQVYDPNRFALEFMRRWKGTDYLRDHICEPASQRSVKDSMEQSVVDVLKEHLSSRFVTYSWKRVKQSLNTASRDLKAKHLRAKNPTRRSFD